MKKLAMAILGLTIAGGTAAESLEIAIGSDMASVDIIQRQNARGSLWGLGLTRNSDRDATTASLTYNVVGNLMANNHVEAGLGWKASYHDTFQRSFSLAVGGLARWELAAAPGLAVEGGAYLAPDVLSTNDTERYHELMARVTYDLHSRATVFVGWVNQKLEYQDGAATPEVEVADGLAAGFAIVF